MNSSLSQSCESATQRQAALREPAAATSSDAVLVREAGIPFQPQQNTADPFVEWLSLMEVVQMLCPVWPVRNRLMVGEEWKL
jgi:hypothetical protein